MRRRDRSLSGDQGRSRDYTTPERVCTKKSVKIYTQNEWLGGDIIENCIIYRFIAIDFIIYGTPHTMPPPPLPKDCWSHVFVFVCCTCECPGNLLAVSKTFARAMHMRAGTNCVHEIRVNSDMGLHGRCMNHPDVQSFVHHAVASMKELMGKKRKRDHISLFQIRHRSTFVHFDNAQDGSRFSTFIQGHAEGIRVNGTCCMGKGIKLQPGPREILL